MWVVNIHRKELMMNITRGRIFCCNYLLSEFLFLLCSWSYGVLLWEIESGGMLSFRDVFIPSFVYTFVLSSSYVEFYFAFFISRCLVTLNYLPRVALLCPFYASFIMKYYYY